MLVGCSLGCGEGERLEEATEPWHEELFGVVAGGVHGYLEEVALVDEPGFGEGARGFVGGDEAYKGYAGG